MNEYKTNYDYDIFSDSSYQKSSKDFDVKFKTSRGRNFKKPSRKNNTIKSIVIAVLAILIIGAIVFGIFMITKSDGDTVKAEEKSANKATAQVTSLDSAKIAAAQYDYDKAISAVKAMSNYDSDEELQSLVKGWEQKKSELVEFPHDQVTHVFYHSLIVDPELAFSGSKGPAYNLVMTTVDEFNAIMQSMYDRGYVMVTMHDMCTFDDQGNRIDHKIMLPPGKKAFVLSQDDVNYYHYQDGDGLATKLIIDQNGKVKNEYIDRDGNTLVGDYDVVPIVDSFVEKHPDFSYKGHKGILALTGYNGALGYRTDSVYADRNDPNLDPDQIEFLDRTPDFDYEKECQQAKKVADALKATGWEFASHTWGHNSVPSLSVEKLKVDSEKWKNYVETIVGPTDMMLFPNGSDFSELGNYDESNGHYAYLTGMGFRMFCTVDSAQCWIQKGDQYFRMGRRNLDGYRMYHDPELLTDLFDPKAVLDSKRPTPVPTMQEVYG